MTFEDYTEVISSKVFGAQNFHDALVASGTSLDFFIVISSAAGAVGNRGQAAYAAANTYLNALAQHRHTLGLPASSIDLTAVSDAGYLAEDADKAAEVMRNLGSDTICEAEVLAVIGAAISGKMQETANGHCITGVRIEPGNTPFWTPDAKFVKLRVAAEELAAALNANGAAAVVSWNASIKAAKSPEVAEKVICDGLVDKIAVVLNMEKEDLDPARSLSAYALDSLTAIEIRNFITREFEANMQVLELLASGSIETLAKAVSVKSKLVNF
jgi:acyl carrier protein